MEKQSTTTIPKLTIMATDETLRSKYARYAPDVPDWFMPEKNRESRFIKWREYYADLMIKHFSK